MNLDTLCIVSPFAEVDPNDDLKRELSFYNQALHSVLNGRQQLKAANVPFTRPDDYFAEMLKSDEHMHKVNQKLVDEAHELKAREEARTQRMAKKFGKKIQQEKLLERQRSKKAELEKIELIKKKKDSMDNEDEFGIELEQEKEKKPNLKRQKKDNKYGFGGAKRYKKENTKESTNDLAGFNPKKMKSQKSGKNAAKIRPGKGRRANMRK
jgi:rRNA-processing protein EBP2